MMTIKSPSLLLYVQYPSCAVMRSASVKYQLIALFSKRLWVPQDVLLLPLSTRPCPDVSFCFLFDHWTALFGLSDFHSKWHGIRLKSCSAGLVSYRMSLLSSEAPRVYIHLVSRVKGAECQTILDVLRSLHILSSFSAARVFSRSLSTQTDHSKDTV